MRKFTTVLQLIRILSNHQRKTAKMRPNRSSMLKNTYPQCCITTVAQNCCKTVVKLAKTPVLFDFYKLEQKNA